MFSSNGYQEEKRPNGVGCLPRVKMLCHREKNLKQIYRRASGSSSLVTKRKRGLSFNIETVKYYVEVADPQVAGLDNQKRHGEHALSGAPVKWIHPFVEIAQSTPFENEESLAESENFHTYFARASKNGLIMYFMVLKTLLKIADLTSALHIGF